MEKHDYQSLDAAIIANIAAGYNTFARLCVGLEEAAKPFCISWRGVSPPPPWRVIDRRLAALRKAKKLSYDRTVGWKVVSNAQTSAGTLDDVPELIADCDVRAG